MIAAVRHESFYRTGLSVDEDAGVYAGWVSRQSSCADTCALEHESDELTLMLFSEGQPAFGAMSARCDKASGDVPGSRNNVLSRYHGDASFPACLEGRFHGLLIDRRRGTTMLFNDRWGMQRLYVHEAREGVYFAAEAKAILAVRPELRRCSPRGLGEMVSCGCVLENRTLFQGIDVLPPASAWLLRNGAVERRGSYFEPRDWEEQPGEQPEQFYQQLREAFARSVEVQFDGSERVGMSLTGGLDTRMIMSWQRARPGAMPCYSFGGTIRDCQDVVLARKIARQCGQSYEVIHVGEEFLSRFPHYAERSIYLTDGCTGAAHAADLYVNERARQIAPVRMTGNYGGEVLRRVRAFRPSDPVAGLYYPDFMTYVREARDTYTQLLGGHPLSFAVFRQAPWHHYGLLALEQTQLSVRSPFLDNDLVQTVYRAPESACSSADISLRLIADGNPDLLRIRTDRGLAGTRGPLASAAIRWLLDFTAKAEYAYSDGMPNWLANIDHRLAPLHLDHLFLGRHKFAHYRIWYRDVLSSYVQAILLDPRTLSRPYLDRATVEQVVRGHLGGSQNHTDAIHQLLTLELIQRRFFDG